MIEAGSDLRSAKDASHNQLRMRSVVGGDVADGGRGNTRGPRRPHRRLRSGALAITLTSEPRSSRFCRTWK